jgi:hypothetical protein
MFAEDSETTSWGRLSTITMSNCLVCNWSHPLCSFLSAMLASVQWLITYSITTLNQASLLLTDEFERIWMKAVVAYLKYFPFICLEGASNE